jgi:hypothetical protein
MEHEMHNPASPLADINSTKHISDVIARSSLDDPLFKELAEVLKKYEAEDRFGITLLHKHFELQLDETLVEYTNEENRIQKIVVEKIAAVDQSQTIETSWSLKDGQILMRCQCIKQGDNHNHGHVY